jgi:AcrR family transcriptional regulator
MTSHKHRRTPAQNMWIEAGYDQLSLYGPERLHIEALARTVGSSKSSFYHHFVDQELFLADLLDHHIILVQSLAIAEAACTVVDPDLFLVLIKHRRTLLVQRQLLLHSHLPHVRSCAHIATECTAGSVLPLLSRELGLKPGSAATEAALTLGLHDVLLSAHEEPFTVETLRTHVDRLKHVVEGARSGF